MKNIDANEGSLASALIDKMEALAVAQQRTVEEVFRDAVEHYVRSHRITVNSVARLTPQEAGARILARRPYHPLPDGETIRDLISFGRA